MTHRILTSIRLVALLAASLSFHPGVARSAEAKAVRVAVGPFLAPAANDELRNAGKLIPELLTVEMSQATRFQLVEREKILNVWSELNLSSASLVARDSVAKLGRVLACDWLISGSLVQANGHTHVWTKVIDVRNGVVVDLNVTPYERGVVTNVVSQIAAFLNQTGSKPKGRQFVVMDSVVDMNPTHRAKREDWSKRLQALMEKHFLDSGFGVACSQ
jgi:TolB-like protein